MPSFDRSALVAALNNPASVKKLDLVGWSALVTSARAANVLGLLAARLADAGIAAPAPAARHLDAAVQLAARQIESVKWEVHALQRALGPLGVPVVLLKGAAYAASGLAPSRGRLFGDIDILVPRHALAAVELRLMAAGWTSAKSSVYDQRYYRKWMHELPPMLNLRRRTVLDIHHTILPLTARHSPDPRTILAGAEALPGLPAIRIPRPEHLLIHSIVHLLHDGELHNGLRDLFDIDALFQARVGEPDFPDALIGSAQALGVADIVAFGLRLASRLVQTPVPPSLLDALEEIGGSWGSPLLARLYAEAVQPENVATASTRAAAARLAIYLRAHGLRMPPLMLVRHLAHKSFMQLKKDEPAVEGRA